MKQTLMVILLSFLSSLAFAKHDETLGCASLSLGEELATKIALMRAKAHWVEQHYGRVVSGRETLLVENETAQLAQTIKTKSAGRVPSLLAAQSRSEPHIKSSQRVKDIEGDPYLCIHLKAVK